MDRRTACVALAAAPWVAARAQSRREARVAWMSLDRAASGSPSLAALKRALHDLGWEEGRNLTLDAWWGEGSAAALRELIPRVLERKPDVIVTQSGPVAHIVAEANVTVPTVFTFSGDPIDGKLVDSYARPGRNRTGVTFFSLELMPKRLELMKEVLPGMKRVALLASSAHAGEQRELETAVRAAGQLGLAHDYYPVTTASEIDTALTGIERRRSDAILTFADALVMGYADRIAAFALRTRIPAVSAWAVFAEKGNLMAYGPVLLASYLRLGAIVDRILRGTRAGDIPVEFPTAIELVVNRKTAQAMGIALAPSVLARANRVID